MDTLSAYGKMYNSLQRKYRCCVELKNAQNLGINSCAAVPGLSVPHDNHFVSLEMLVK